MRSGSKFTGRPEVPSKKAMVSRSPSSRKSIEIALSVEGGTGSIRNASGAAGSAASVKRAEVPSPFVADRAPLENVHVPLENFRSGTGWPLNFALRRIQVPSSAARAFPGANGVRRGRSDVPGRGRGGAARGGEKRDQNVISS